MEALDLQELVQNWLAMDRNEQTRDEIQRLWDKRDTKELERRMRRRIEFGTAGLREKMEAGWSRMNDLIIIQTSQGLCRYVLDVVKDATSRGIVVGHDHRHHSERWAQLTAATFLAEGVKVYLHRGLVHTPLVPFSVKRLNAACGVMITASHNPKDDNGYKVYWENAVQIIGPHDKGISDAILANLVPKTWSADLVRSSPDCLDVTQDMKKVYFECLADLKLPWPEVDATNITFVNTSMHGVGHPFVSKALENFRHVTIIPVVEQQNPDPDFPTVAYPNPEEKGALDLALATADAKNASYVLAQDPDADRFSAAEKQMSGEWVKFTGDQLGVIFAGHIFDAFRSEATEPLKKLAMVASTVSSKMIEAIAEREGFKFVECLTGFKYIGNMALDLVKQGYHVPFGYEEAIGFMFGSDVRDKDGVAATVMFVQIAQILRAQGQSVKSYLDDLYERYGYFMTSNSYFICREPTTIDRIFKRIRNYNVRLVIFDCTYPQEIAGLRVTSVVDLTTGYDSTNPPTYEPHLPISSGHMIQFRAQRDSDRSKIVLTMRTSGTEPKIKYYLEGCGKDKQDIAQLLSKVVQELGTVWMEADKNNLGHS
ncbi:phosphoglucomutase 1 [Moniliophthora roreri MCA 2997]|uniref:Phosphoglucomutase 1 n=1 Tax=Moniliophthora roreri (strain MCA 2997) TaxID=1381753 RepID=V2XVD1_MONRO|nr:phosphoglucomutase 1 [Moniliophthora roreri MCA 2997]